MNIEMLDDRVLVKEVVEKETVKGGIIIGNPAQYNSKKVEVISFSPLY